jgi:hypothetical protein
LKMTEGRKEETKRTKKVEGNNGMEEKEMKR